MALFLFLEKDLSRLASEADLSRGFSQDFRALFERTLFIS
jgi:hypothetical protein